jgi:glucose/arabinose dehydrogenase
MRFHVSGLLIPSMVFYFILSVSIFPAESSNVNNSTMINVPESSDRANPEDVVSPMFNLTDPNFEAQLVARGLNFPTSMAFLAENDMLVLEKENGTVRRIVNGQILEEPLIDVNVYGLGENGLLGVDTANNNGKDNLTNVFLYFTESQNMDKMVMEGGEKPLGNRVYRYDLANNTMINPKLILDLPYSIIESPMHNGGKIMIGPDENVYVVVGDLGDHYTEAQNAKNGVPADGSSGVLTFRQDGKPVVPSGDQYEEEENDIVGRADDDNLSNLYYAYGIRNSFGMDFDPATGNLWITENGPDRSDEINLVEPGFNGGYDVIQGMIGEEDGAIDDLVDFDGKGKYSDPELEWDSPMGVTAIKFLNSTRYGEEYYNDVLVGDFNYGNIYRFELDEDRESLILGGNLSDKIADNPDEMNRTLFGHAPGAIVDMQVSPKGYLYVLSLLATVSDCDPNLAGCVVANNSPLEGVIYRIVPRVAR